MPPTLGIHPTEEAFLPAGGTNTMYQRGLGVGTGPRSLIGASRPWTSAGGCLNGAGDRRRGRTDTRSTHRARALGRVLRRGAREGNGPSVRTCTSNLARNRQPAPKGIDPAFSVQRTSWSVRSTGGRQDVVGGASAGRPMADVRGTALRLGHTLSAGAALEPPRRLPRGAVCGRW